MTSDIQHFYEESCFGENWFSYPSLYKYVVEKYPTGSTFVEIGSWKGKSSAYMAVEIANSKKDINFFCIDTWEGSKEHSPEEKNMLYGVFLDNMKRVKNYYSSYRLPSLEAVKLFDDESVDFVFIDGSHEYEDVLADIRAWYPKVKKNGILAGHDYHENWPSVQRAVDESFNKNAFINGDCWAVYKNV